MSHCLKKYESKIEDDNFYYIIIVLSYEIIHTVLY